MDKRIKNVFIIIVCIAVVAVSVIFQVQKKDKEKAVDTVETEAELILEEEADQLEPEDSVSPAEQEEEIAQQSEPDQEVNQEEEPFPFSDPEFTENPEDEVTNEDEINGYVPYIEIIDNGDVFGSLQRWVGVMFTREAENYLKEQEIKGTVVTVIAKTFIYNKEADNCTFECQMDTGETFQVTVGMLMQIILIEPIELHPEPI